MAGKKKNKNNKNNKNNNNRPPVGSAPPPEPENKDLVDSAPDPAAAAVEDALQVCRSPYVLL